MYIMYICLYSKHKIKIIISHLELEITCIIDKNLQIK